jgi:UDP-N-acetylmuramoyl-tripeptide--D-alanyl-D-alanine ligase
MIDLDVGSLVEATAATLVCGSVDARCHGCVIDSRAVREGDVFVAFPGENVDGNDYAIKAMEAGASCVVMT